MKYLRFSVYITEDSTGVFDTYYPFYIRVDGGSQSYIGFKDLPKGEWVTVTVDLKIASGGDLTMLGIYVPKNSITYIKDVELSATPFAN